MLFDSLKVITNGRSVSFILALLSCYNSLTLVPCGKKRTKYQSCLSERNCALSELGFRLVCSFGDNYRSCCLSETDLILLFETRSERMTGSTRK